MSTSHHNLAMIFTRTNCWGFPKITITPSMLRVLGAIDGEKSVAEVAELLSSSYADLFTDLQQLHDQRLIELIDQPTAAPSVTKEIHYRGAPLVLEKQVTASSSTSNKRPRNDRYRGVSLSAG